MGIELATSRLLLREFTRGDLDSVHAYASDSEVTRYLFWGPNTREETRSFIDRCVAEQRRSPRESYELAITLAEEEAVVGGISLVARRLEYSEYELGYCLNRAAWRLGYAEEATRALLTFGFTDLGAHRIYALVDPENPASIRLIEKLRFRREGLQLQDTLIDDKWRDTLVYAALAEEWRDA